MGLQGERGHDVTLRGHFISGSSQGSHKAADDVHCGNNKLANMLRPVKQNSFTIRSSAYVAAPGVATTFDVAIHDL